MPCLLDADTLATLRLVDTASKYSRLSDVNNTWAFYKRFDGLPWARLHEFDYLFGSVFPGRELPPADRWRSHFDFVFDTEGRPELYIITPGRLTRYQSAVDRSGPQPMFVWSPAGGLAPPPPVLLPPPGDSGPHFVVPGWDGPFYVAADGADRHFVVPGGRVFTLPADAPPGSALVKTWDADPILALVHDSDAGKSYAFTRTHSFHITSKPDPKPHALTAFPGATAEEALDTVAKCGRVIRGIK